MATRRARRLGARVILAAAVVALVGASLPASAAAPVLLDTSVDTGWATTTRQLPGECEPDPADLGPSGTGGLNFDACLKTPGGANVTRTFNPLDPPFEKANGHVQHISSRWSKTLDTATSTITVSSPLGAVAGTVVFDVIPGVRCTPAPCVYDYDRAYRHGGRPAQVMTFKFASPLTAPQAPLTATFTGCDLPIFGGLCSTDTRVFGLDRRVASVPNIEEPGILLRKGAGGCNEQDPDQATDPLCPLVRDFDPVQYGFVIPGSPIVVSGTASDPLTWPNLEDPTDAFLETSGIKAVVIRLYNGTLTPNSRRFLKSYTVTSGVDGDGNPVAFDCSLSHVAEATIERCADTQSFSFTIPSGDLAPGSWYAIDVLALDVAGYRAAIAGTSPANPDNLPGAESDSITWLQTV